MKKDIDWGKLGFGSITTDKRYVADYREGQWQEGRLTDERVRRYPPVLPGGI